MAPEGEFATANFIWDGQNVLLETDVRNNTQNSYRYEAFGQIKSSSENVTNYYKYVGTFGVHHDSAVALYFMQARYYKAAIGHFISMDLLRGAPQDPLSLHRYAYVSNSPVNAIDPTGLKRDWFCYVVCEIACEITCHITCELLGGNILCIPLCIWLCGMYCDNLCERDEDECEENDPIPLCWGASSQLRGQHNGRESMMRKATAGELR